MRKSLLVLAVGFTFACSSDDPAAGSGGSTGGNGGAGGSGGDPSAITKSELDANGHRFDLREAGPTDGALVIMLHGFPETSYEWHGQLGVVGSAGYHAVAPDQRGYSAGARPPAEADYAMPELVADVLAIADALGSPQFHLVGHDWGAAVAWAVAGSAPERLLSLTAMSVPHPDAFNAELADMTSCQYQASSYFDFFETPESTAVLLANDAAQLKLIWAGLSAEAQQDYLAVLGENAALDAALNWYRANVEDRQLVGPLLGMVATPTLFLWSDMDSALCQEGAEATASYVSGPYQFEIIQGVDHWIPENAIDEVNSRLLDHFAAND